MYDYQQLQILYNPGTCGRFLASLCKQMRDKSYPNPISHYGSSHVYLTTRNPTGVSIDIVEHHIRREELWKEIAIKPRTKNIFVKMSNYREDLILAMKLHFIKRYYDEDELQNLSHDYFCNINSEFESLTKDSITRHMVEKLFYYFDNFMVHPPHNILFAQENLPPESDTIMHLDFRSILNGNPDIVMRIQKFTGFKISLHTYSYVRDYARAQINIEHFLAALP
jgi:hypothetical protein